jgi:hypothetical protein
MSGLGRVHDAYDENGDVQIKMTAGQSIAMYGPSKRLVVFRIARARSAASASSRSASAGAPSDAAISIAAAIVFNIVLLRCLP